MSSEFQIITNLLRVQIITNLLQVWIHSYAYIRFALLNLNVFTFTSW